MLSSRLLRHSTRGFATSSADKILSLSKLKQGDVVIQNSSTLPGELEQQIVEEGAAKGVHVVSVCPNVHGFDDSSIELKFKGGLATVTDEYAQSFRLPRLLSDLPAPLLVINHGKEAADVALPDLVQLLAPKGVLATVNGGLPKNVKYGGEERTPVAWTDYLKKKQVSVKKV